MECPLTVNSAWWCDVSVPSFDSENSDVLVVMGFVSHAVPSLSNVTECTTV